MAGSPTVGPFLRIVDLSVAYGPETVLHEVCLAVPAGVAEVVGPNGAGKTTLLRAISGVLRLRGGRVVAGRVEVDGPVAHVLAGGRVFAGLTVEENLRAGAGGLARRQVAGRLAWALDRFPMFADRRTTLAGHLSGGERQLLTIARGLMAEPRVLLLDEPTVGLAPAAVSLVSGVVAEAAAGGVAVVVTALRPGTLGPADAAFAIARGRTHSTPIAAPTPA